MKELKLSEYILKSKQISSDFDRKIKIAVLSSFTVQGIKEVLSVKCSNLKISPEIYVAGYNQYNQELLNKGSEFYRFKPDLSFLILDTRSVLREIFFSPYQFGTKERKKYITEKINEITNLINLFIRNSTGKLILTSLLVPSYSPLGIVEEKTKFSLKDTVQHFNSELKNKFIRQDKVFIYDFNAFISRYGENNVFDYKLYYLGDIKISPDYLPNFCEDLMAYIKVATSLTKKCIVLDLDDTLWGGIIGEDGFENIKLGPGPPGNAYYEFQRYLLSLFQRGIILAINSKNNPSDALRVIREHPYMVLREENFACLKINWQDKVTNMREIVQDLDIGLNSLVFIDDDPLNRELVKKFLPEVLVVDLPNDPSLLAKTLMDLNDFSTFQITEEDQKRGKMYTQQRQRQGFQIQFTNIEDFLKSLEMKVEIKKADSFTIPRISQLTLKTNQFNLTTKRYSEEDIKKFAASNNYLVYSVRVADKFGDNGITGVFIINKTTKEEWLIDTFLLSCRIIGRNVEKALLGKIINLAKSAGAKRIFAQYIPTSKNKPCEKMYQDNEFLEGKDNKFYFDTKNKFAVPDYIKIYD